MWAKEIGSEHGMPVLTSCQPRAVCAGRRILVADDEALIRELLYDLLDIEGASLCFASSGSEALDTIQTTAFDLAILDIQMPPPDGLAILRRLRALGHDLPVLILTAYMSAGLASAVLELGDAAYMRKPFDPDALLHVIGTRLQPRSD